VNFGFLYGMGVLKFIETAWSNYGVRVSEEESRAFREAFFGQFPMLLRWHARQRQLVSKYKRVESPLGRVRHLPDIDSPNQGVRSEAERQAINSPVQSFASDMALLSMVRITREFQRRGMRAHPIGTVHDAINWEVPEHEMAEALPLIKDGMENLPLRQQFGVNLDVPIVADLKAGFRWGGATELSVDQVYNWRGLPAA
jgi:DNA polymerase I-like protein with 3'-5' exonuclease and polymerase domains